MSAHALAWAWTHVPALKSAPLRLTLVALADRADDDGELWPKVEWVAEKVGAGKSTVRGHIAELERLGLLTREPRRREDGSQSSNTIRLTVGRQLSGGDPRQPAGGEGRQPAGGQETTRKETTTKEASEFALALHAYYSERRGTTRKLAPGTAKLIDRALNSGFNLNDLKLAVDGLLASEWHREKGQLTLSTIFKTGPGTESFEDRIQGFVDRALRNQPSGAVAGSANVPDWIKRNLRVGRENPDDRQAQSMFTAAVDWLRARRLIAAWDANGKLTFEGLTDEAA